MDPRRPSRTVSDPIVRQVGFTPQQSPHPATTAAVASSSSAAVYTLSPPVPSLSPVIIPPPLPDTSLPRPVPAPRRPSATPADVVPVGSYEQSDSLLLSTSPELAIGEAELSEGSSAWIRTDSGKFAAVPSVPSVPSIGFNMSGVNSAEENSPRALEAVVEEEVVKKGAAEVASDANNAVKTGVAKAEMPKNMRSSSRPLKEKTTKAERRALQEAQRAAKAPAKVEVKQPAAGGVPPEDDKTSKVVKQASQKKDVIKATPSVLISDKKGGDRPLERDKKKDVPPPRMQYDDKSRVDKAKKRSIVKQTEAQNRVELFRHLPQYEHGNQLPDLESKFFHLDALHPAVYKVGLQYLAGDISGGNARCVAMLHAFKEAIKDYCTPPEKVLSRDLTTRIGSFVSFLIECRPLSFSMGNAVRFLKGCIAKLPLTIPESEAKAALCSDIDRYINEKIVIADKVIVEHATAKINDGDVLLTYGCSSIVEMILLSAHELGKRFRVVVVDSRPKLEGQALLRRLLLKGLSCTYTHINAVSYIMHEVSRVLLGAASILSNGTMYSRIGTASVAMVAHAFQVPVLVCCEAYKFHERVQLDSICSNELGDPDVISKVPGRRDVNYSDNWTNKENLQLLNLLYDVTPSDFVSMIVTDYGMVPPTSIPVIVREYRKEHLLV